MAGHGAPEREDSVLVPVGQGINLTARIQDLEAISFLSKSWSREINSEEPRVFIGLVVGGSLVIWLPAISH